MKEYDLLIIYKDGEVKIVKNVTSHAIEVESRCFMYEKYGYRSFIPMEEAKFFGKAIDY